ncbi:uncharacterized protein LOC129774489 [Toxorhynchites rutilus septentrionalis]|uniref:uncharacterized protein LOC129774489 n=1 Tax=Toxorhynchites rutilus septentrionalis TaxID=329112 RepID=UPI002479AA08|nr:uncharacterized protein LOC129774489 [Toxorhynchites rutilus septentrionalis]
MAAAKHAVGCGMSVNAASIKYQIPRITLARWIVSPQKKKGLGSKKSVFSAEQETELVQHLLDLEARFYGITMKDVQKLAYELAERNGIPHPFNHKLKMAGRNWLDGFLRRNQTLSFRKPEATSADRARGFNKVSVGPFFDLLRSTLDSHQFPPARIFNADETGISTVPSKKLKIAAKKGKKQHVPPYMIFPRVRMHDALKRGAPNGTKFNCNPSGYMTSEVFLDWFDHFLENVNPTKENPALLIIDGNSSHTKNLAFAERARANFVTVLVLPPHCSNKIQPLDVAFMGPFKSYYAAASENFMRQNPARTIGLYDVCELMGTAFLKAASGSVTTSDFRKCGIWPYNRHVFSNDDFAPSEVTDQPEATVMPIPMVVDDSTVQQVPLQVSTNVSVTHSGNQYCTDEVQTDGPDPASVQVGPVSEISPNSSFNITPSEILPLPKMSVPRATKRKRKSEKAVEITGDGYRQNLASAEATKTIKSIKKGRKPPKKRAKGKTSDEQCEDTLCELCGDCFSDSTDGYG